MSVIIVKPYDASKDIARDQRFITAGTKIIPSPIIQPLEDLDALVGLAKHLRPKFEEVVKSYADRINCDFEVADNKEFESASGKAIRKGSPAHITDFLRASLYPRSPNQIAYIGRILSPIENSAVVAFENSFSRPNIGTGLRRTQSIIRISDDENFMFAEIQGRHPGFESALKKTHALHRLKRGIQSYMDANPVIPIEVANKLNRRVKSIDTERLEIHAKAARQNRLDRLIEQRAFFAVKHDGAIIPAFVAYRKQDETYYVARPDAATGCYVIDNNLLQHIAEVKRTRRGEIEFHLRNCIDTSNDRNKFISASEAIAQDKDNIDIAQIYGRHTAQILPFAQKLG